MIQEATHMWKRAGFSPFFHGCLPTVVRDVVFGGAYTVMRYNLKDATWTGDDQQWACNMASAAVATIASGPFNLARNVQFATSASAERPSIRNVVSNLWHKALQKKSILKRLGYLQNRLRIGWGTARVAAGMALGQQVYDTLFTMASGV